MNQKKKKIILVRPVNKPKLTMSSINLKHVLTPCKVFHVPFALKLKKIYLKTTKL